MSDPTVKRNATKGDKLWLPCVKCTTNTFHVVEASIDLAGEVPELYDYWQHHQIVQCQGCGQYSFRLLEHTSDDVKTDPDTGKLELVDHATIFPPRIAGRAPIRQLFAVPSRIRSIYEETHKALLGRLPILTGVGLRSLIEAVCREKGANGSNLQKRIDSLVELGVLTRDGADILHALRNLGNSAAHEVEAHDETDLSTALDVVEHLLQTVYIIPKRAAKLRKKHFRQA